MGALAKWENFIGRTSEEIKAWIRHNVEYQIGNLVKAKNRKKLNTEFMLAIEAMKGEAIFSKDETVLQVEASPINAEPYTVTLKQDGTYTTDRELSVEK